MYVDYYKLGDLTLKMNLDFPLLSYDMLLSEYNVKGKEHFDVEYDIKIVSKAEIESIVGALGQHVYEQINIKVYAYKDTYVRVFSVWKNRVEYLAVLRPASNLKFELLCEPEAAEIIENSYRIINMLGVEDVLLDFDAMILHSVVISHNGKTVLFTAPSGTGKTTHASLWQKLYGSEIVNGDRGIIKKINGVYCACGSPYAGTSGESQNVYLPISAVVVLSQSKENKVREMTDIEKFKAIYSESTVNSWSSKYIDSLVKIIEDVISSVKVISLSCNMQDEAAKVLHNYIFG